MTEDNFKVKMTEINELKRMDVVAFYQLINTYNANLDKRIKEQNKPRNKRQ